MTELDFENCNYSDLDQFITESEQAELNDLSYDDVLLMANNGDFDNE